MELLTAIVPVLLPFIVTALTSATKRLPIFDLSPEVRTVAVRLVAAVFSFLAASTAYMFGGDPVTQVSVNELVLSIFVFLGALGGHNLLKKS